MVKVADIQVTLLQSMGTDLTVVNAARVSFDKESDWNYWRDDDGNVQKYLKPKDVSLIEYLANNGHWSPFAHCQAQFRIKAPIFVARQLVKHQVGLAWNEVSRRYVDSEPELYFPAAYRKRAEDKKQGSSDETLRDIQEPYPGIVGHTWSLSAFLEMVGQQAVEEYQMLLDIGMAPEQARMFLPLNTMTEWFWTGSLYAFARVCKLRLDPHAQEETRQVAERISEEMTKVFPHSWNALMNREEG